MTPARRRATGLDVALVVDATMDQVYLDYIHCLFTILKGPVRVGIVAFGDHAECAGTVADDTDLYDVRVSRFKDLEAQRRWFDQRVRHVSVAFWDAALECGLAAAVDLEWREEAAKRVFILGWSLPHDSLTAGLPVRTGVACPTRQCWKTHLDGLAALPKMEIIAASPRTLAPRLEGDSFMELLRAMVWKQLSVHGRLDTLDPGLGSRWSAHLAI